MDTTWSSPESGNGQVVENENNVSVVEAFMVDRIGDLQEYGWSNDTIAEALGVNVEFVEERGSVYENQ